MTNRDVEAAIAYHNDTKHSLLSIHSDPHYMDFSNQPLPFKIYTDLDPIPLPRDIPTSGVGALAAVASDGRFDGDAVPNLPTLASLLHHAAGITKKRTFPRRGDSLQGSRLHRGPIPHRAVPGVRRHAGAGGRRLPLRRSRLLPAQAAQRRLPRQPGAGQRRPRGNIPSPPPWW